MNEKITEQLLEYMNSTKDFILTESPELIREILHYEKWSCIFALSILVPVFIGCLSITIYNWIYPQYEGNNFRTLGSMFGMLIPGVISFICFMMLMETGNCLIKINTAPKYFIIQKIMNLGKK
jgi:ABC-type dipeptide/oligopeptide/nickel transport system permease component